MKIFIDPGHGGEDPGATSNGILEKNINLSISLYLKAILQKQNFEVEISRDTDTFITLEKRSQLANNWNADLFISIHVNSSQNENAMGIETLVYSHDSNPFTHNVQNNLVNWCGAIDRGVKIRSDLYVLKRTKMPAMVIETGFISNKKDRERLTDPSYQQLIAGAIAIGIVYTMTGNEFMFEDIQEAIKHLSDLNVIRNPEYWFNAVKCVKYLDELILNMANKI